MMCYVKNVHEVMSVSNNLRSQFHKPPHSLQINSHGSRSLVTTLVNITYLIIFTKTVTIPARICHMGSKLGLGHQDADGVRRLE